MSISYQNFLVDVSEVFSPMLIFPVLIAVGGTGQGAVQHTFPQWPSSCYVFGGSES